MNNISSTVEALKFYYDGGVNISNYLNIKDKTVYFNLFNSSGFEHGTLTDFNNINDFGYRFINSPATNGPGTTSSPANQYFSWMLGLGLSYNYDSFGCHFCIARNAANPVLSVRYKESNPTPSWTGWTGITASDLYGLAVLTAGNWLRSSDSTRQRLFFCYKWYNLLSKF